MARFVFRMPDVGEGITEAEIVAWHVQPGARIDEETRLVDVMTDKATVEVESPVSGTVVEVAGEIGSMVPVGATLAVIETEAEEAVDAVPAPQAPVAKPAPEAAPSEPEDAADAKPHPAAAQPQVLASPAVRARARDLGLRSA